MIDFSGIPASEYPTLAEAEELASEEAQDVYADSDDDLSVDEATWIARDAYHRVLQAWATHRPN